MNASPTRVRSRLRTAVLIAVLIHVAGAAWAFLYAPEFRKRFQTKQDATTSAARTATRPDAPSNPPTRPASAPARIDQSPTKQPKEWNQRVEAKVGDQVEAAVDRNVKENRILLAEKASELNRISTPRSVDDMTATLQDALGLTPRVSAPTANPPKGRFDATTAQIHTVRKEAAEDGSIRYVSVMIDTKGRTMEVELDGAEGESIYETMKLVEENPLLKKIYRQLVVPALDKATQTGEKAVGQ